VLLMAKKYALASSDAAAKKTNDLLTTHSRGDRFGVPIVPHSGGIGLNEYTQHLALEDYLCVSGEKSLLEHINSFSEVLRHPVKVHDGYFATPHEAGYSVEYKSEAILKYLYPTGTFWMSDQGLAIRNGPRL
jgi:L-galactonate dehydratase